MQKATSSDQDERIRVIDVVIRSHDQPGLQIFLRELADHGFEISERTLKRDLRIMKTVYEAPIVALRSPPAEDGGKGHYFYAYNDADWNLEIDQITSEDLAAIAFARDLLKHSQGLPEADILTKAYDKLLGVADEDVRARVQVQPLVPLAFAPLDRQVIDPDVWKTTTQAARDGKSIRMIYDKNATWSPKGKASRLVDPYAVVMLGGTWYLLGSAGLNDPSLRQYNMSRIRSAKRTSATVALPPDFDLNEVVSNAFGRFIGDRNDLVTVKVRFAKTVHPLVTGQRFHEKETRTVHRDKSVTVSFPASQAGPWPFYHVVSWILSWGPDVEVLAPPQLRQLVEEKSQGIVDIYTERAAGTPE